EAGGGLGERRVLGQAGAAPVRRPADGAALRTRRRRAAGRRPGAGRRLGPVAAGRPPGSRRRQHAGAAGSRERRERAHTGVRRLGQRQRLWPCGDARDARAGARRGRARRRHRHRFQPQPRDARPGPAFLRPGRGPQARTRPDPIGGFAASGTSPGPWPALAQGFAGMVRELAEQGFRGPFAAADGRIIHNAGGSEAQELAFAIASAVQYLRTLATSGVALDAARHMIYFRLSADADQFPTMAKFRAVRKLWARIEEACGLAPKPACVAAETAWRMMTRRDPYVNMLRNTIAVAAAGLGGADSITVLPHTAALGLPDAFARRIARNTQLILLEESNLAKV